MSRDRRFQGDAAEQEDRIRPPGTTPAPDEPETPELIEELLPPSVKAELKSLPKDLAATVGAHVIAAGQLIDEDPELAWRHAEAARRRAGRVPVVREAAAETAYAAGKYDVALREFRAIRRMNGGDDLIPVMADCERALGRHRDALELLESIDSKRVTGAVAIEALLVEAGTRSDMGQREEALRLLKNAISRKVGPKTGQARLRYAYAEMLLEAGDTQGARSWFESAGALDVDASLDVTDRVAELDGVLLPDSLILETDESQEPETADQPEANDEDGGDQ